MGAKQSILAADQHVHLRTNTGQPDVGDQQVYPRGVAPAQQAQRFRPVPRLQHRAAEFAQPVVRRRRCSLSPSGRTRPSGSTWR